MVKNWFASCKGPEYYQVSSLRPDIPVLGGLWLYQGETARKNVVCGVGSGE